MCKKIFFILTSLFCLFSSASFAQQVYRTCSLQETIKTLRLKYLYDDNLIRPILQLDGDDILEISFDELSHNTHAYSYTLLHCNADWTQSDLLTSEYLSGFTTANITDYALSENTTQLYTHYTFTFPNEDMQVKVSGNYAVQIYEDGDTEKTVAWVCFSVVEPHVTINADVRFNTDIEFSGRFQQIDLDISTSGYPIKDPVSELNILVRQNNRTDNEVFGLKPTFIEPKHFRYYNCKDLIFEGGNEYRSFDIPSVHILGYGVEKIHFDQQYYHAFLEPSENYADHPQYMTNYDVNGQFVINAERVYNSDVEADYMWVHFFLPAKKPYFNGVLYVGGDLNNNLITPLNRMDYDAENQGYIYSQYLKQGGYNYQYWFVQKGSTKATNQLIEGSFWQTVNEYTIYVYHRPFGSRYDKLIGFKSFTN